MEKRDTDKTLKANEKMDKTSDQLTKRTRTIDAGVITISKNP